MTANLIAPGATQTGWLPRSRRSLFPMCLRSRIDQPEDIADAIVLLASQQARWINCSTVFVDGSQGRSN